MDQSWFAMPKPHLAGVFENSRGRKPYGTQTVKVANFAKGGLINIAGGCCGNTPEHIAAIAKALEGKAPRKLGQIEVAA